MPSLSTSGWRGVVVDVEVELLVDVEVDVDVDVEVVVVSQSLHVLSHSVRTLLHKPSAKRS